MSNILEIVKLIVNSPIASFFLAVFGIIIAVVFYYKGKRLKNPTFSIRSFNLVKDFSKKLANLEVFYSGDKVENLTVSKVAFWNDGNETIRQDDIASSDHLKININDKYVLYDVEVLASTNKANQFNIHKENNISALITFEYLDPNDGAVIQVTHSGLLSEDITITGTIKGAGSPTRKHFYSHSRDSFVQRIFLITNMPRRYIFIRGGLFYAAGFFLLATITSSLALRIFYTLLGIIFIMVIILGLFEKGIPKKLKIFGEEI